jgi:DNA modification methylase
MSRGGANRPPAAPEHPVSEMGDLWLLGRHRLLCGDSTVATDVERVLGGVEPHLMVTDQPYGVSYDPSWRHTARRSTGELLSVGKHSMGSVSNDDRDDWREAWALWQIIRRAYEWCLADVRPARLIP